LTAKLADLLRHPYALLLLICAASFFAALGGHTLWDVDEPNNAVCAREMLIAGNWWVPMFNGDLRFDKPILIYWLMMPLNALFGVNEWTARLPSALAMSGLVLVVFNMTKRLLNHLHASSVAQTALMAAAIFATALHIVVIARAAVPDPLLMLSLGFALPALLLVYLEKPEISSPTPSMPGLLMGAYVAIGLGVLAKGPIAGLMPLLIIGVFLTLMGGWRHWRIFHPWMGIAIALLVAMPWYVTVGMLTDGEWLQGFIFHHNLDRFTGSLQGHHGFPGLYLLSYLVGWFPWTGLIMASMAFGAWRLQALRQQPVRLFMLCWIGIYLIFFSVASTQLPNYILPAFPAGTFLMALAWSTGDAAWRARATSWLLWGALLLVMIILLAGGIALEHQWSGDGLYILAFLPLLLAALIRRVRAAYGEVWHWLAGGMLASVLLLTCWSIPAIDHHKVSRDFASAADQAGFDGTSLATFRYFQPTLLYYHGGRLPSLATADDVGNWLMRGKAVVLTQEALSELPKEMLPYFIVHKRAYGLYARHWLMLISLQPPPGSTTGELLWPNH